MTDGLGYIGRPPLDESWTRVHTIATVTVGSVILLALSLSSLYSYLLFHSLVELVSVSIAGGIFMFAWNSRRYQTDDYFLILGVAYLVIGLLDLLHTLAYRGMGVFPDAGTNVATQIWVATRSIESVSLLGALWVVGRRVRTPILLVGYAVVAAWVVLSVFVWRDFPDCFIEGSGLTLFKKLIEYAISLVLLAASVVLYRKRRSFSREVYLLLQASLLVTIASELVLTLYLSAYGLANFAGHVLKLISFFLIYRAIIEMALVRPNDLLFRENERHQAALERSRALLEARVAERTQELAETNQRLRFEIAEQRRAEAEAETLHKQLRQARKMEAIGTMAGGIAHDFNNILSPILGYTEMVRDRLPDDSDDRRKLDQVLKASHRAKDLVRQILTFSRRTAEAREPVVLSAVVDETIRLLRATLPTTVEIRQDIDAKVHPVIGDPGQLQQVLMNLCTNAFHAMRGGGVLAISLHEIEVDRESTLAHVALVPGRYLKLDVSDTGQGMEPAVLERIFEPYFTTKVPGEGTGLGLSIVHGIIKSHGGHITAYSELGRGTTFHIYLPCIDETGSTAEETATTNRLPTGTERIVVVDDEPDIVEMIRIMLEGLGYRVTGLSDSLEALERIRADPASVDVLLTDMTMPRMTGSEMAQELLRVRPDLPIILSTGFSELITAEESKTLGIKAFLMKPVLRRDLARTVRRVLDER